MSIPRLFSVFALTSLAGCGAEVAGTAATAAKLQAINVEQARAQEAHFKKKLDQAMQRPEAAAAAAETP